MHKGEIGQDVLSSAFFMKLLSEGISLQLER